MKSAFAAVCFVALILAVLADCWPIAAIAASVFLAVSLWDIVYGEEFED